MLVQHSPPARKTRSHARAQAVLSTAPKAPLESSPANSQLRAQLDRGPHFPGEDGEEEEENSVEEEDSADTAGVPAPVGESQGTAGPALAQYDQLFSH
ncbi:hypothetical protein O181_084985 [Austropuccinia psidii MF-1]|uniref:Uncharacterized protein n=1 Tax=Austropuccinia psidii MF-1 TaxID=1389203 RepID=A0A9Q3FWP1_9BASI|nr:hypothetical protein [Austropuccinia psidii MF-1]